MWDNASCTDFFSHTRDCVRVTIGNWFVIGRSRQSCSVRRAYRQVFQKTLSGRELLFRNSVYQIMECVAAHPLLTLGYCMSSGRWVGRPRVQQSVSMWGLSNEVANVAVHQCGLFVDHPVRAVGDALHGQVGHKLVQTIEVPGEQRGVLLTPDD
jgi:hypothetical protein